jgi:hypothetical protein
VSKIRTKHVELDIVLVMGNVAFDHTKLVADVITNGLPDRCSKNSKSLSVFLYFVMAAELTRFLP